MLVLQLQHIVLTVFVNYQHVFVNQIYKQLKMYIKYEPEKVVENNDNIVTENQI